MPNRMLKDSINESRGLTKCSFFAQDLYKRLITYADDYGRFNADTQIMLARLYPRELAIVTLEDLIDALIELAGVGKIQFYTGERPDDVYAFFPNWEEHQRLRESKKKLPDPADSHVNEWYKSRFIPHDMKVRVVERDKCKCQKCGSTLWVGKNVDRFVKMGTGLFHIEHIVPVQDGGITEMDNLRMICADCYRLSENSFTFDEILEFAAENNNSRRVAASCGELRRVAARREEEEEGEEETEEEIETEEEGEEELSAHTCAIITPIENPFGDCDDNRPDFNTLEVYASNNILGLSGGNMEQLLSYRETMPDDLIRYAIDAANRNCKTGMPTFGYLLPILKGYVRRNITSVRQAKALDEEYSKSRHARAAPDKTAQKNDNPLLNAPFY